MCKRFYRLEVQNTAYVCISLGQSLIHEKGVVIHDRPRQMHASARRSKLRLCVNKLELLTNAQIEKDLQAECR